MTDPSPVHHDRARNDKSASARSDRSHRSGAMAMPYANVRWPRMSLLVWFDGVPRCVLSSRLSMVPRLMLPLVQENATVRDFRRAQLRDSRRQRRSRSERRHRRRLPRDAGDRSRPRAAQRRDGPARGRQGEQEHRALHRLDTFPCRAHDRLPGVSRHREVRELQRCRRRNSPKAGAAQIQTFSGRSPMTAELLKDAHAA